MPVSPNQGSLTPNTSMLLQSFRRVWAAAFFSALLGLSCFAQTGPANTFEGVQIEVPAGGHIRIENRYGEVAAEVWKEKYVSVTATIEGPRPFERSPVVISNRNQLLAISIIRRPAEPIAAVKLSAKIPETAQVEIITGSGRISMRGVPSSAAVRSMAGGINIEFLEAANADIAARSAKGFITSELPQLRSEKGHVLQARVGTGQQTLRINSQTGDINLSETVNSAVTETTPKSVDSQDSEGPTKGAGIPAPASDAQEISEGDVIRVDSQLVTLNMSVIDRNTNRGLIGLTKSDFRLFENSAEQQILQFESSSAPFDLLLLIDVSGSTRDVMKLIRSAALRFVNAARPSDRIGVIAFAGEPSLVSPLTLNRQTLHQRVNAMDTAGGDTKIYDATDFAVSYLMQEAKNTRRKAIILMSDGLDGSVPGVQGDGSKLTYKELLNRVQEFDGVLYTLWLNTEYRALSPLDTQPEAFDAGYDRMKEMAVGGGGVFYEVERLQDLAGAYERVVADLGTVYSLAYRPSDKTRDGRWRAIRVDVNRPSSVARGKRGYYAN